MKSPAQESWPNRQSIRLKGWDYATPGWYFVTMCAHGMRCVFGTIVKGRVLLNDVGRVADDCWREIPQHFPPVALDEFVVMPNHVHGLLRFAPQTGQQRASTLGDVIGAYKSAVSRRGRQLPTRPEQLPARAPAPLWHRNYWDVIVRDDAALANVRRYIRENPQNYEMAVQGGEPQCIGNPALMQSPKLGFLASRDVGASNCSPVLGNCSPLPLRRGETVISGFLSPMERRVFRACLAAKHPMIWVKPWGIGKAGQLADSTPAIRAAVDEGRLLLISPFADADAPSVRRAAWCNEYVMNHCGRLIIGNLRRGGMLELLLADAPPELEVTPL
ncbi:MAG: transposase [Kiritimatiellaeota bacterium]|nr:transposase [Kiritimatiellota bacterium]